MYRHVKIKSIFTSRAMQMIFHTIDSATLPQGSSFLVKVIHRMGTLLAKQTGTELASITDFNVVEWRVVSGLHAFGRSTQKALVDYTGGDQAQTSRVLASLEKKGMVRSEAGGADRRARNFELTEIGLKSVEAAMPDIAEYFRRIDQTLTADEKATFIALLNRLLAAAESDQQ